jgi:hypothetical protein
MLQAFLMLAAEAGGEAKKSETLFFVIGCVFAAWAVVIGTIGSRSESFGRDGAAANAVIGVSVLLAAATMFSIVYVLA